MTKLLFTAITMLLIVLPAVFSAYSNEAESNWFKFENSVDDSVGGASSINHGVTYTTGKVDDYSGDFGNGQNDWINVTGLYSGAPDSVCIAFWYYVPNYITAMDFQFRKTGDADFVLNVQQLSSSKIRIGLRHGESYLEYDAVVTGKVNQWVHFTIVAENGKALAVYINATKSTTGSITTIQSLSDMGFIGADNGGSSYFVGYIDDLRIWYDAVITDDDVTCLYNEGAGFSGSITTCGGGADTTAPVVNITYPQNNEHINIDIGVYGYVTDETGISNITANISGLSTLKWNWTSETDTVIFYNFTGALSDGIYTVNISTNDTSNNINSSVITFIVDTTAPVMLVVDPENLTWYSDVVDVAVGCTDTNPYRLNYTLYDAVSGAMFNSTEDRTVPLNINVDIDTSTATTGTYQINFTCSDSHTTDKIQDYEITKDISNNKITFNNDVSIRLISNDAGVTISSINSAKSNDRYNFDFGTSVKSGAYTFEIKSSYPIVYLPDSQYKGHFVTGKYWIDFNNNDISAKYSAEKIDSYTYRISITTISLNFNSIGELNIVKQFRILYIDNDNPEATSENPEDNYQFNDTATGSFECSATDNYNLFSLELWTNSTGTWQQEDISYSVSGVSGSHEFSFATTINITAEWSCRACDSFAQCDFSENRTYKVSYTEAVSPPSSADTGAYSLSVCVLASDSLPFVLGYMFLVLISFLMMGMAWLFKVGLLGFGGAMILLVLSLFLFICLPLVALILSIMAIALGWHFIVNGWFGRL